MNIEKVSLAVQIEGKAYFVNLSQEKLHLVVHIASGLADNGKLNVVPAPEGLKFAPIGEFK